MIRTLVATVLLVTGADTAFAQITPAPAEPVSDPRLEFGPLSVRPALMLRDVGYDSNVFNTPEGTLGDYTATFGAKVDLGLRSPRVEGTYTGFFDYLYFQKYESERGTNRGADGRMDFLLGRLRPYVAAGISRSHDRPTAEIDERADRGQSSVGAGVSFAAFSRTKLVAGYRHTSVDYADDEFFRGENLAVQLNERVDLVTVGADFEVTVLTTISVFGDRAEDRFERSPDRDADSYRAGMTVTLQPSALIAGRATIGYRAFRPVNDSLQDFSGLTAAVALTYALRDRARVALTIDRDLRYSFAEETPYYVSTGGRLTWTQLLFGDVDAQLFGGLERIDYKSRADAISIDDTVDNVRLAGGGVGYRVANGSRVAINIDYTTRSSPADDRDYSRRRIYGTLTVGF